MKAKISEVVKKFTTTPFLFVGSGLTRRYYNLPDWKGLLEIFVRTKMGNNRSKESGMMNSFNRLQEKRAK